MALAREDSSPLFAGNVAGTLRLIAYLALAMVLMVLDHRNGWMWRIRYSAAAVVEPMYRLANMPTAAMRAASVAFADRQALTEQNQRLREDLLLANAKLNRMASVAQQNERLKQLLDTQRSLGLNVQLARVVGVDLGADSYRLLINRGARDGVKVGQPVIDAHGIMGQVVNVLPTMAQVMLLTDPTHAIPVVIERTGLRTVAYGDRDQPGLSLPNIPMAADVKPGDRLVTSGVGGRFPPGFPVGTVRSVAPAATGMFMDAHATPAAQIHRSDDVLLLHDQAEPMGPPAAASVAGPPAALAPAAARSVGGGPDGMRKNKGRPNGVDSNRVPAGALTAPVAPDAVR